VLICDDAIFMRTMVSDILQQAGFDVIGEAETGLQAVEKYKQLKPDLVTMDIVMPDMGGIDAVREITRFDPAARVLMCSAMGQQALVVEAIQAGARGLRREAVPAEPRARGGAAGPRMTRAGGARGDPATIPRRAPRHRR
jgi:two-component system chemotaxis response regulator CheY